MDPLPWIALKDTPGIGNLLYKRLIERFSTPENVLSAEPKQLIEIPGISPRLAQAVSNRKISDRDIREIDIAQQNGVNIITMRDPAYPALLLEIPDPPPFLYVRGTLEKNNACIAVIGSRKATSYGLSNSTRLATALASAGFCVVSGMARGIDTAAHKGALGGNGQTIAVLGSGLGKIYPPENRKLSEKIAESGAVISEFSFSASPEPRNFPMRNRIISGLSLGTVVVEAAGKSGSLITARLAAEQNREVFAVPGSIHSFKSSGTHRLLKEGAKLVERVEDIIEEFSAVATLEPERNPPVTGGSRLESNTGHQGKKIPPGNFTLDLDEMSVLKELDLYPIHIDVLQQAICMEPGKLSGILLKLELKGIVHQSPGKRFSISEEIK